jgi:hypothetical protein
MIGDWRGGVQIDGIGVRPKRLHQHVVDDLHDHLAGRHRLDDVGADRLRPHLVGERTHHIEGDVGLQQRPAHFAHGGVDVVLGEGAAPRQLVENAGELFGKALEHGVILVSAHPDAQSKTRPGAHRAAGRWPPASQGWWADRKEHLWRELRRSLGANDGRVNESASRRALLRREPDLTLHLELELMLVGF